jgi:hypothetical protein
MTSLTPDRLAGAIAGALLLRAVELLNGLVIQFTLSADNGAAVLGTTSPLFGYAAVLTALGFGYLQAERKPVLHRGAILVLSVSALIAVAGSLLPYLMQTDAGQKYRGTMIASGLTQAAISALLLAAVIWLYSKERALRRVATAAPAGEIMA